MKFQKNPNKPEKNAGQNEKAVEQFIDKIEPTCSEESVTTTLRFPKHLLQKIDAAAKRRSISRSAWIKHELSKLLEDNH